MATVFHSVCGYLNFWYTVSHIIKYIKYSFKITKYWIFKTKLHLFVHDLFVSIMYQASVIQFFLHIYDIFILCNFTS